ncbi:MAG TPA: hypothetical protein VMJ93_14365 [Verrucomicrobiae bacterium]|nr:hypothetical protein [Verrucomicrobiae bacterium]
MREHNLTRTLKAFAGVRTAAAALACLMAAAFAVSLQGSTAKLSQSNPERQEKAQKEASRAPAAADFSELRWRLIGPFRGGRTIAAAGVPGKPYEYYFGGVAGGVWKTENAGLTWTPIFDKEPIASIGAIAVAASEPEVIYAGSGEADMRSDISFGDGMYKSTDGGATWKNIGLEDSQQIGSVIVDPHDPNIVLVAALGHAYGPNEMRGVYRTTDGGATWTKVLGKDDNTGAIDLCFDPGNSRVVYASLWQARREPWAAYGPVSGPGSGLYKSLDGGVTWKQITGYGFPSEGLGRIGVAVAAGNGGRRVYAIVDAKEGGVYRSDDAGETWKRVFSDVRVWQRGWYFGGVTVDPQNPDAVYVANTALYKSTDGGEHFEALKGAPGGDDYHQLWIAPENPRRMILACDQGASVSVDGGATWSSWYNQPTGQFYHVTTDNEFPYRVYGPQQDSGTAGVSERSDYGQMTFREWAPVGGEESGYIAVDKDEPDTVYSGGPYGGVWKFDRRSGQSADISPWPREAPGSGMRFNWNAPLVVSPQNPHTLYFAAQMLMKSENDGTTWKDISGDLTLRPGEKETPGKDRGVIYTIAPSPARAGEIWTGSDNGVIQLTTDEGKTWSDVTPAGLPDWSKISLIEASRYDAATAYAAVDRHQVDDDRPYVYRTRDYGKTWQNITAGLPENSYVHVVREDTKKKGLLFAGTETGVYVSLDDGGHWNSLQLNLPVAPIHDINIHENDIAVATHGRAFWILDDIEPIREWSASIPTRDAYLFHPVNPLRIPRSENRDTPLPHETPVGENPPAGASIDYYLKKPAAGELVLEIRDRENHLVRRFTSEDQPEKPEEPPPFETRWLAPPETLQNTAGMHRFVWDLRYAPPEALHEDYSMGALIHGGTVRLPEGPMALPGQYQVLLIAGEETQKQTITPEMDPRVRATPSDLEKQLELALKIDKDLDDSTEAYRGIERFREKLKAVEENPEFAKAAPALQAEVKETEAAAADIAGHAGEWPAPAKGLRQVNSAFTALANSLDTADMAPTDQAEAAFAKFQKSFDELVERWKELSGERLTKLNEGLKAAGLGTVSAGEGEESR